MRRTGPRLTLGRSCPKFACVSLIDKEMPRFAYKNQKEALMVERGNVKGERGHTKGERGDVKALDE